MLRDGCRLLVSYHPSAILRAPSPSAAQMRKGFAADLSLVARFQAGETA